MPPPVSPLRELMQVLGTLLIAAVGGIGFHLVGFPGGLVSGSMLTVAVAALAGCAVKIPRVLARLCFVLVGILLGAVVTPDTLKGIASWPLSVALLVVAAICMMTTTACYLRLAHGWDPVVGIARCEPGLDGASDGTGRRVRRRCARDRNRARDARALDRARPARGACAVRLDRRARCVDAGRDRTFARRTCDPPRGIELFGTRHAAHKISGRPHVRRHGRLRTSARDGFDPCVTALVGRRGRCAHAGRGRRREIREYEPQDTAGLSGGGLWLVCG